MSNEFSSKGRFSQSPTINSVLGSFFNSVYKVLKPGGKLILRDNAANKLFTWFANKVELPLANLTGHGDVKMHTLEEVRGYCKKANLKVEKLEQQSRFRMHLVAVKE